MSKIALFNESPKMTVKDFVSSMEKDIFVVPFENSHVERIYPVETSAKDDCLFVHMSDDTTFKIQITKHR
jgi:hypothetical protein